MKPNTQYQIQPILIEGLVVDGIFVDPDGVIHPGVYMPELLTESGGVVEGVGLDLNNTTLTAGQVEIVRVIPWTSEEAACEA